MELLQVQQGLQEGLYRGDGDDRDPSSHSKATHERIWGYIRVIQGLYRNNGKMETTIQGLWFRISGCFGYHGYFAKANLLSIVSHGGLSPALV